MEIQGEDIILRDHLALDRTRLANQRTLLAFIRTSLYLVVSGLAVIQVKVLQDIYLFGWILIACSIIVLIAGVINYFYFRKKLNRSYQAGLLPPTPMEDL